MRSVVPAGLAIHPVAESALFCPRKRSDVPCVMPASFIPMM
jgi:hypothetical protein